MFKCDEKFIAKIELLKMYDHLSDDQLLDKINKLKFVKECKEKGVDIGETIALVQGDLNLEIKALERMYKERVEMTQEQKDAIDEFIKLNKKLNDQAKLDRIQIRCTAKEKKEFSDLAKLRGMNTSEFLRTLIKIYKNELTKESINIDINQSIDRIINELQLLKR